MAFDSLAIDPAANIGELSFDEALENISYARVADSVIGTLRYGTSPSNTQRLEATEHVWAIRPEILQQQKAGKVSMSVDASKAAEGVAKVRLKKRLADELRRVYSGQVPATVESIVVHGDDPVQTDADPFTSRRRSDAGLNSGSAIDLDIVFKNLRLFPTEDSARILFLLAGKEPRADAIIAKLPKLNAPTHRHGYSRQVAKSIAKAVDLVYIRGQVGALGPDAKKIDPSVVPDSLKRFLPSYIKQAACLLKQSKGQGPEAAVAKARIQQIMSVGNSLRGAAMSFALQKAAQFLSEGPVQAKEASVMGNPDETVMGNDDELMQYWNAQASKGAAMDGDTIGAAILARKAAPAPARKLAPVPAKAALPIKKGPAVAAKPALKPSAIKASIAGMQKSTGLGGGAASLSLIAIARKTKGGSLTKVHGMGATISLMNPVQLAASKRILSGLAGRGVVITQPNPNSKIGKAAAKAGQKAAAKAGIKPPTKMKGECYSVSAISGVALMGEDVNPFSDAPIPGAAEIMASAVDAASTGEAFGGAVWVGIETLQSGHQNSTQADVDADLAAGWVPEVYRPATNEVMLRNAGTGQWTWFRNGSGNPWAWYGVISADPSVDAAKNVAMSPGSDPDAYAKLEIVFDTGWSPPPTPVATTPDGAAAQAAADQAAAAAAAQAQEATRQAKEAAAAQAAADAAKRQQDLEAQAAAQAAADQAAYASSQAQAQAYSAQEAQAQAQAQANQLSSLGPPQGPSLPYSPPGLNYGPPAPTPSYPSYQPSYQPASYAPTSDPYAALNAERAAIDAGNAAAAQANYAQYQEYAQYQDAEEDPNAQGISFAAQAAQYADAAAEPQYGDYAEPTGDEAPTDPEDYAMGDRKPIFPKDLSALQIVAVCKRLEANVDPRATQLRDALFLNAKKGDTLACIVRALLTGKSCGIAFDPGAKIPGAGALLDAALAR